MNSDRMARSRTITAPPSTVFAVLRDPARHRETKPGDWVRDAIDPEPISRVGRVFGMNMYAEAAGGDYVMHNHEPDDGTAARTFGLPPFGPEFLDQSLNLLDRALTSRARATASGSG